MYYAPGFNKPNGTGECIVSLQAWNALDAEMKAIISHACAAEAAFALSEMERLNIEALNALVTQHHVKLMTFPADLVSAAAKEATDVLGDLAGRGAKARKVHDSYMSFRERVAAWSRISLRAVLEARG
jgi:TRAP-type mannitol/chloroaromatic compound transport system substrate-binding protein